MTFEPISKLLRNKVVKMMLDGWGNRDISVLTKVSIRKVQRIRSEEGIGVEKKVKPPVKVAKFKCPICHTFNNLKMESDDNICLMCFLGMREKGDLLGHTPGNRLMSKNSGRKI